MTCSQGSASRSCCFWEDCTILTPHLRNGFLAPLRVHMQELRAILVWAIGAAVIGYQPGQCAAIPRQTAPTICTTTQTSGLGQYHRKGFIHSMVFLSWYLLVYVITMNSSPLLINTQIFVHTFLSERLTFSISQELYSVTVQNMLFLSSFLSVLGSHVCIIYNIFINIHNIFALSTLYH